MKSWFSPLSSPLVVALLLCGALGITITVATVITIPTAPATHTPSLHTVIVGPSGDQQQVFFDATKGRIVISGGLVVGAIGGTSGNSIAKGALNSIILGGIHNTIGAKGITSTIGAGQDNIVNARTASIGAGYGNDIEENAEGAFIGGGRYNTVSAPFSSVAAGRENTIQAAYSLIPGGTNNSIGTSAPYSFAAGQMTKAQHSGSFLWSDYDDTVYRGTRFTSTKENTFLIRAKKGVSINTGVAITGVNVNINGGVLLGSEGLIYQDCTTSQFAGTYEFLSGCLFYCDGLHRQTIGLDFEGDDLQRWCSDVVTSGAKAIIARGGSASTGDIALNSCDIIVNKTVAPKHTKPGYSEVAWYKTSTGCASRTVTCEMDGRFSYVNTPQNMTFYSSEQVCNEA